MALRRSELWALLGVTGGDGEEEGEEVGAEAEEGVGVGVGGEDVAGTPRNHPLQRRPGKTNLYSLLLAR